MPILTYHHIDNAPADIPHHHKGLWVAPKLFAAQMRYLKDQGYQSITPSDLRMPLLHGRMDALPRKWVLITFDDGWRDNLTHALPILQECQFTATLFLSTGALQPGTTPTCSLSSNGTLNTEEISQWLRAGCQVESHTVTHAHLDKLSEQQVRDELMTSREDLKKFFGIDSEWLCYPYGHFSRPVAQIAEEVGYIGAFSTIRDNRFLPRQRFWIPRVQVMNDTHPKRLGYMCSWLYHCLHQRKNRRRYGDFA